MMVSFTLPPQVLNESTLDPFNCINTANYNCYAKDAFRNFGIQTNYYEVLLVGLMFIWLGYLLHCNFDRIKEKFKVSPVWIIRFCMFLVLAYGAYRVSQGTLVFTEWVLELLVVLLLI